MKFPCCDELSRRSVLGAGAAVLGGLTAAGLSTRMAVAARLPFWQGGSLAAVHAVGQPNPTRSHFAAMEAMENAAPGTSLRSGWLGRTLGIAGAFWALAGG